MATAYGGKHASTASSAIPVVEPSHAERARTLLHMSRIGSLSTMSRRQPGYPFGSLMPYSLDVQGHPIFLISTMAMHTQNLEADARASLLITQAEAEGDPLGASRVTLMGKVTLVPEAEKSAARQLYLARHENSSYWVDFADFAFYRMNVVDVYYVGGFGVMGWVPASEYEVARPDPLAEEAAAIMTHMNADHGDALVLLAREHGGFEPLQAAAIKQATMTSIDRLGFHLRLKAGDRVTGTRIAFPRPAASALETRKVLVEMVQRARQRRTLEDPGL